MSNTNHLLPEEQIAAQQELERQKREEHELRLQKKREMRANLVLSGEGKPWGIEDLCDFKMFHYAIINDLPGKIKGYESRGYDLVRDKAMAERLNQKPSDPIRFPTEWDRCPWAYLMRIERELFEEDQRMIQADADAQMAQLSHKAGDVREEHGVVMSQGVGSAAALD